MNQPYIAPLCKRMGRHRTEYRKCKNIGEGRSTSAFKIFDEFGLENCKIELVEFYPCASKMELERKEGEYIKNNDCVNKAVAGRSKKEWAQDHPGQASISSKKYYNSHKDVLLAKCKERRLKNAEYIKEYYENNKDITLTRAKESVICNICGGGYTRSHKSRHYLTENTEKL